MGLTAGTLFVVYEFPFLPTSTAVTLPGAEVVQERPLLSRESKTRLSDCGVVQEVGIDHQGRLQGFSPLTADVNWSVMASMWNWDILWSTADITGKCPSLYILYFTTEMVAKAIKTHIYNNTD